MEESIPKLWDRGGISSREDTVKEQSPIQLQCRRGQPWDEASCCLRIARRIRCRLCGALGPEVLSEATLPPHPAVSRPNHRSVSAIRKCARIGNDIRLWHPAQG